MADIFKVRPNAVVSTDDGEMYAEFAASVPEVDSDGEIVFPEEFDLSQWEQNPIWLWNHNPQELPIGMGNRKDGTVAAWKSPEMLRLGCKFSQVNPNGAMLYGLYREGVMKMVSPGFRHSGTVQISGEPFGVSGNVRKIPNPLLVECSCVPIGANPGAMILSIKAQKNASDYFDAIAIASVIDNGHFHGEKLTPELKRFLTPFADTRKKSIFAFRNLQQPALQFKTFKGTSMASIAKKETQTDEKAADEVTTKADETPNKTEEKVLSVGVQAYKAFLEMAAGGCKGMAEMLASSDSEDVKTQGMKLCSELAGLAGMAYESASSLFPDSAGEFEEFATQAMAYAAKEDNAEDDTEVYEDDAEEGDGAEEPSELEEETDGEKTLQNWTVKAFGSDNPREAVLTWVREAFPHIESLDEIASELAEVTAGLEAAQEVLVGR